MPTLTNPSRSNPASAAPKCPADPACTLIDQYAMDRIEYRVDRLRKEFGLNAQDAEDLTQDMLAALLAKPNDSVVVGPVGFKKSEAPSVLEYGGDAVVLRRRGGKLSSQKVKIAPRPYMAPALEKERPNLPLLWRNSIRKGGS